MDLNYRDIKDVGQFRAVRLWHDDEGQAWVIDAERADGSLSTQDWGFIELDEALHAFPLFIAVLVRGVAVTIRPGDTRPDQAQAPAVWIVTIPIEAGGQEVSEWPNRRGAENFLRRWVAGR